MKLYVEQADRIVAPDDPDDLLALVRRVNPLAGELAVDDDSGAKRIVTWSGTLGPDLFIPAIRSSQESTSKSTAAPRSSCFSVVISPAVTATLNISNAMQLS